MKLQFREITAKFGVISKKEIFAKFWNGYEELAKLRFCEIME